MRPSSSSAGEWIGSGVSSVKYLTISRPLEAAAIFRKFIISGTWPGKQVSEIRRQPLEDFPDGCLGCFECPDDLLLLLDERGQQLFEAVALGLLRGQQAENEA